MQSKARSLRLLGEVSDMKLEAELAELARFVRAEEQLYAKIQSLEAKNRDILPDNQPLISLANHAKWVQWRGERQSKLNLQLAALKADKEVTLKAARKAFGRVQAIRSLAARIK